MKFNGVMKAKPYQEKRIKFPVYVQPKLNGNRGVWNTWQGCFTTKNDNIIEGLPIATNLLSNISSQLCELLNDSTLKLDGELIHPTKSFNESSGIIRRKKDNISPENVDIAYHIFDYVSEEPFEVRTIKLKRLIKLFDLHPTLKLVKTKRIYNPEQADQAHLENNLKYEGTIYRDPKASYKSNRTLALIKRKDFFKLQAKIISFERGEGKYSNTLGALGVKVISMPFKFKLCIGSAFTVGSGLTDIERSMFWSNKAKYMGENIVVSFQSLSEYAIPNFPIYKGLINKMDLV